MPLMRTRQVSVLAAGSAPFSSLLTSCTSTLHVALSCEKTARLASCEKAVFLSKPCFSATACMSVPASSASCGERSLSPPTHTEQSLPATRKRRPTSFSARNLQGRLRGWIARRKGDSARLTERVESGWDVASAAWRTLVSGAHSPSPVHAPSPGYWFACHVPPNRAALSMMRTLLSPRSCLKRIAEQMPDTPPPTMILARREHQHRASSTACTHASYTDSDMAWCPPLARLSDPLL